MTSSAPVEVDGYWYRCADSVNIVVDGCLQTSSVIVNVAASSSVQCLLGRFIPLAEDEKFGWSTAALIPAELPALREFRAA